MCACSSCPTAAATCCSTAWARRVARRASSFARAASASSATSRSAATPPSPRAAARAPAPARCSSSPRRFDVVAVHALRDILERAHRLLRAPRAPRSARSQLEQRDVRAEPLDDARAEECGAARTARSPLRDVRRAGCRAARAARRRWSGACPRRRANSSDRSPRSTNCPPPATMSRTFSREVIELGVRPRALDLAALVHRGALAEHLASRIVAKQREHAWTGRPPPRPPRARQTRHRGPRRRRARAQARRECGAAFSGANGACEGVRGRANVPAYVVDCQSVGRSCVGCGTRWRGVTFHRDARAHRAARAAL